MKKSRAVLYAFEILGAVALIAAMGIFFFYNIFSEINLERNIQKPVIERKYDRKDIVVQIVDCVETGHLEEAMNLCDVLSGSYDYGEEVKRYFREFSRLYNLSSKERRDAFNQKINILNEKTLRLSREKNEPRPPKINHEELLEFKDKVTLIENVVSSSLDVKEHLSRLRIPGPSIERLEKVIPYFVLTDSDISYKTGSRSYELYINSFCMSTGHLSMKDADIVCLYIQERIGEYAGRKFTYKDYKNLYSEVERFEKLFPSELDPDSSYVKQVNYIKTAKKYIENKADGKWTFNFPKYMVR